MAIRISMISISCLLAIVFLVNLSSTRMHRVNRNKSSENANQTEDAKLSIEVYYESLCPDSEQFINTQLSSVFEYFQNITNVFLVPYGTAKVKAVNMYI